MGDGSKDRANSRVGHACPVCGRNWALRGSRASSRAWVFWCRFCHWRSARHTAAPALRRPRSHEVRLYADDAELVYSLEDFLLRGWSAGGAGIVIATQEHRAALRARLEKDGLEGSLRGGRLIELDAASTLQLFMRDGSPDRGLFHESVGSVVREVAAERPLHCFGEMVDVLWAQGNLSGALELERLWAELQEEVPFSLLCSYATEHVNDSHGLTAIARQHDTAAA